MTTVQPLIGSSSLSSSDSVSCYLLPQGCAGPYLRERIAKHLEEVIEETGGKVTIESILDLHDSGAVQVWLVFKGGETFNCMVSDLIRTAGGKKLRGAADITVDIGVTKLGVRLLLGILVR